MILQIFSVYDSKVEAYIAPFYGLTIGSALRDFEVQCNDAASNFNRHPEDYTIFHLGSFEMSTGKFEILPTPHSLGLAITFIHQEK